MVCTASDRRQVEECERAWWRTVVRSVFDVADATPQFDDFERFFERLFAHFATAAAWCCADGAAPALAALRARGLHVGMVSNFDHRLPPLLDALGQGRFAGPKRAVEGAAVALFEVAGRVGPARATPGCMRSM